MFDALKKDTDLASVDIDIRGKTETEVYEQSEQIKQIQEQTKEPEASYLEEGVGHLRFNTAVGSLGESLYDSLNEDFDPDFEIFKSLSDRGMDMQSFSVPEQKVLNTAVNEQHLDKLIGKLSDKWEYQENAKQMGAVSKFAIDMGAEVFNVLNWVPILGAAGKVSRAQKMTVAGLQGAGWSAAEEVAVDQVYHDRTAADVIGGAIMGGTVSGGLTGLINPTSLTKAQAEVSNELHKMGENLVRANTAERIQNITKAPDGSVGAMRLDPYEELAGKVHAQFKGDPADPHVMQAFEKTVQDRLPQMKGRLRPEEFVGVGEYFQRSSNPMERYLGSLVVEHAEGTGGKVQAEHSADLLSDLYFHEHAAGYVDQYNKNSKVFKSDVKYRNVNDTFDNLLQKELNARDMAWDESLKKSVQYPLPWQKAVIQQADAIEDVNKKLYKLCKDSGVTEFSTIKPNEFYLARQYDAKKMIHLSNMHGKSRVINVIKQAILTGDQFESTFSKASKEGVDPPNVEDIAQKMAQAVFNRMSRRSVHTGADANILQTGNQKLLMDALEDFKKDAGISEEELKHIRYVLDSAGKDRFSNPNKSRIKMNLHAEADGIKMIDLLESDLAQGYLGHLKNWTGRAALAKKGFPDKGVFDKAVDSMVQVGKSRAKTDKDLKKTKVASDKLQASWELIRGVPIDKDVPDSVKKPLRALRKFAGVSKLGKLGFAQAMETGRMAAAVGVHRMMKEIPALPRLVRDAKTGKLSDTFLQDIEAAGYGRIGDEYMLSHPAFRVDELHEGAFKGERTVDAISYGLNNLSGFNTVTKMQKRMFARQYGMKLWREITENRLSKAVQNDLGFSSKDIKSIKGMMEKYAEPKEGMFSKGVANLNVRKWEPELREKFIAALHKKSSNAIQKIQVGDLPLWAHHTYGQFLSQFRSFGLASAGKHGVHDLRMGKSGNMEGVNAMLFGSLSASMLYIAKTEIDSFGLEPRKRRKYLKNRLKADKVAVNASKYMSQLGLLPDAALYLGSGLFPDAMGEATWGRTGAMTPADLVSSIPGVDYAGDVTRTGQEAIQAMTGQDAFTQTDFKAAWGLLPMNNLMGVTNVKNVLENNFEE